MGDIRRRFMLPAKNDKYAIYYTSTTNDVIEFENTICSGIEIVSNSYDSEIGGKITFSGKITEIEAEAFTDCISLTSITIPDSVTEIGDYAFQGCSSLTSVTIPDGVTKIKLMTFYGCSSLTSVTIPDSVTLIGNYAFSDCTSLTSVNIPDSVTEIGDYAFQNCNNLTSVIIPDSVTSIGDGTFFSCDSLTSVTIGKGVTYIGYDAFYNCSLLNKIIIYATVAPNIQSETFTNVKTAGTLCYPYGADYSTWMSTSRYYLGYYNWNSEAMSNHPLEVVFISNNGRIDRVSKYEYKSSMGQPIGIVVVPDGFAPDGQARMISLEPASTTSVTWQTSASDTALLNYPRVSITGNTDTTIKGNQVMGIFPSDAFNALQSYVDPKAYYSSSTNTNRIPSPYYNDAANPSYHATPYGKSLNALSDFNGQENTSALMANRSIHPAINAIYSFNNRFPYKYGAVVDWYLPSIGELGYVMARLKEIRNLMNELGASSTPLHSQTTYLWSSTEATASAAWDIWLSNGSASGMYSKTSTTNFIIPWPMAHV